MYLDDQSKHPQKNPHNRKIVLSLFYFLLSVTMNLSGGFRTWSVFTYKFIPRPPNSNFWTSSGSFKVFSNSIRVISNGSDGTWSKPRNLGPRINSAYIEQGPRISSCPTVIEQTSIVVETHRMDYNILPYKRLGTKHMVIQHLLASGVGIKTGMGMTKIPFYKT